MLPSRGSWRCSPRAARPRLLRGPRTPPRSCPRLQRDDRLQRAHEPDGRSLRPGRAGLRRREERADQGLRQSPRTPRRRSSPTSGRTSTTSGTAACWGWRCIPNFPADALRVRALHATTRRSAAPRRAGAPPARPPTAARRPPGPTTDGCVVSGRLSRLQAAGNVMTGTEQVLIEDWCQQYPSHSVGTLEFGPDGALYASAGDGASFNFADYGQDGSPLNPCGDPPGRRGRHTDAAHGRGRRAAQPGPAHPGRSRDARRHGHPRRSRDRRGPAANPLFGSSDRERPAHHRLRLPQPFRFTFRPGTTSSGSATSAGTTTRRSTASSLPPTRRVENFGWPCYEGNPAPAGLRRGRPHDLREPVRRARGRHEALLRVPALGQGRPRRELPGRELLDLRPRLRVRPTASTFPAAYQGALFFADYSRDCIWAMRKVGGNPIRHPGRSRPSSPRPRIP